MGTIRVEETYRSGPRTRRTARTQARARQQLPRREAGQELYGKSTANVRRNSFTTFDCSREACGADAEVGLNLGDWRHAGQTVSARTGSYPAAA
jgi:hypothetical protein